MSPEERKSATELSRKLTTLLTKNKKLETLVSCRQFDIDRLTGELANERARVDEKEEEIKRQKLGT